MEAKRMPWRKGRGQLLPFDQQPASLDLDLERAGAKPSTWLDRLPVELCRQPPRRELALIALARLARDDPQGATRVICGPQRRFSAPSALLPSARSPGRPPPN